MGVSDPIDVLDQLRSIHASYCGPKPWDEPPLSNPVKDKPSLRKYPLHPHTSSRTDLSGRSGSALVYALRCQSVTLRPSTVFEGQFRDSRGRLLLLENGVISDLLAIGACTLADPGAPVSERLMLTGLGVKKISEYFPNHGLQA